MNYVTIILWCKDLLAGPREKLESHGILWMSISVQMIFVAQRWCFWAFWDWNICLFFRFVSTDGYFRALPSFAQASLAGLASALNRSRVRPSAVKNDATKWARRVYFRKFCSDFGLGDPSLSHFPPLLVVRSCSAIWSISNKVTPWTSRLLKLRPWRATFAKPRRGSRMLVSPTRASLLRILTPPRMLHGCLGFSEFGQRNACGRLQPIVRSPSRAV